MNPISVHQQALLAYLEKEAFQHGGVLSFADFMKIALYAPGLGYYSAGMAKIGKEGDFITAPEVSSFFSQCVANQCAAILNSLSPDSSILELGAGTGRMASDLLLDLKSKNALPRCYMILEVSADLKERQQVLLQQSLPDYYENIKWITDLNDSFSGIILANEVIDALPVHLFKISEHGDILEGIVTQRDKTWTLEYDTPLTPKLPDAVQALQSSLSEPFAPFYTSEILLSLSPWLASLGRCLEKGVMLFIDYGFPRHEYYHPSRNSGTLMCHSRHRAHSDPMQHIGLQDITSHVDFTALALAAKQCGLNVAGFTTQANFLMSNGLLSLMSPASFENIKEATQISQQIQMLTAPHEMGELFKVMALTKKYDEPLQGFQERDHRHRLG